MIRQSRKIQFIILFTLVCLVGTMTIAYAVLSTTLNINGTAQVMDASWNVHFDNIEVNPYSVPISPKITDNDKITFQADLTTPGQFYKFTVDIVNEGSIDAMIESIIKNPELTTDQKKYLRYEIEYVDGTSINESQILKANEAKTISILVSYRNDIPTTDLPTTETNLELEIRLVYVQATSLGTEVAGNEKNIKVVNGDLNTIGSEICIEEECFYVISSTTDTVTLFSKYNLYAGYKFDNVAYAQPLENPTGIQDERAKGYFDDYSADNPLVATISFSSTNYWENTVSNYPANIYSEKSYLYRYLTEYKNYLEEKNIKLNDIRLINYQELERLGCRRSTYNCTSAPSWVYTTSYWTGTAKAVNRIFFVVHDGRFIEDYYHNYPGGIRPVIVINKTEF